MGKELRAGLVPLSDGAGDVVEVGQGISRFTGGERVVATTSDRAKAERLRVLGASEVVNYREHTAWSTEVLRFTAGRGVDLVVEIGGAGTLQQSIKSACEGGRVVMVGLLTGFDADTKGAFMSAFLRDTHLSSVHVGHRCSFEEMNRASSQLQVRPVIDSTFPFERAPQAYAHLMSGTHFGKIVIDHG